MHPTELLHQYIAGEDAHDFVDAPGGLGFAPLAHFGKAKAVQLVDDAIDAVGAANDQDANHLPPRLGGRLDGDLQCGVSQG